MTRAHRAGAPALRRLLVGATALASSLVAACDAGERSTPDTAASRASADSAVQTGATAASVDLTGAGATFPYPLYARWFNEYATVARVRINYRSVGSAIGIRDVIAGNVDFGATDVPMSDSELAAAGNPVIHVPTALGAVGITYNVSGLTRPLRLSGELIADIFLGRVTRWSDPAIASLNPGSSLPDEPITVVRRGDGSGTTYILTDYLSAVSPAWAAGPGRGREVQWPVGRAGTGNEGVAGEVKQTVGTIGYLEVVYARQNRLPVAHVRNRSGRFVSPMPFEVASASTDALRTQGDQMTAGGSAASDLRVSIVNAPDAQAYPIASFTWMLISPSAIGPVKTRQLAAFLRWALLEGGDTAAQLGYVALPGEAANRVLDRLDALTTSDPVRR